MTMRVISLGWGVQSFALAAMSALSVLPPVDAALHADTTYERYETYDFAKRWTPWLEDHGIPVVTVKDHLAPYDIVKPDRPVIICAFTLENETGKRGMLRRSCTQRMKIAPMRRWVQAHRNGAQVEKWMGITLDEIERMRGDSGVKYIDLAYPFIEQLDRPWTRGMAMRWLVENKLEVPVRSSCYFCPYHNRQAWRDIQLADSGDWERAIAVDEAIRHKRPGYTCYLTAERKPLVECDFRSQEEHGQLTLWEAEECSGMCFL